MSLFLLLVLILVFRIHAFIALLIASIAVGLFTGMDLLAIADSIKNGMGNALGFIATVIGAIPTFGLQLALAALALYLGYWWINRFLDERRTPAGLAKLTDDDWFRMITAALVALLFAGFFLIFSGLAKGALDVSEDFFGRWLAPKFDSSGRKIAGANAKFLRVELNGQVVQENAEMKGPTPDGVTGREAPTGPLMFQGNHGPVAYRNIKIKPLVK